MEKEAFSVLETIIQNRRSVKPDRMNGEKVSDDLVKKLLNLADWAPTHGRTEPWRFIVYTDQALNDFGQIHADMYRENTDPEKFKQEKADKYRHYAELASHLIIVIKKRTPDTKYPDWEELCATAAATQNILLAAEAAGLEAMWNTGGMATKPAMKAYLGLEKEDQVVSFLYLGHSDKKRFRAWRRIDLEKKIVWKS